MPAIKLRLAECKASALAEYYLSGPIFRKSKHILLCPVCFLLFCFFLICGEGGSTHCGAQGLAPHRVVWETRARVLTHSDMPRPLKTPWSLRFA